VIGRGLLRRALGAYLAIEPRHIVFAENHYGRPEIAALSPKPICFNVSHTEGVVATVFSLGSEVGVDAERIRTDFPHLEVARRHFHQSMYAELTRLPLSLRSTRVCEFWVLLEAYVKACGRGISLPFADATFAFEGADCSSIRFTSDTHCGPWQFWLMGPFRDHRLAIATSGTIDRIVIRRLRSRGTEMAELPMLAYGGTREGISGCGNA
jgi:4'-phosphopantetheinyl transferase